MNETVKVIFGLIGGLAMFLYGMNNMSDALQKAAGEKMKMILGFLTKNPLMGALAGALVTAVLQSSSATTVMVIGFVSAGLMPLPQAISVIFGANIGTTMTAQLLAFKISDFIYPILFAGFLLNFISKKERTKNIGMVILSFGLLFEGIEIMGSVMKPLADSAVFVELMAKVKDIPILGVLLGALMTVVVQSSSATIAVLQNFAGQAGPDGVTSIMGLAGAIPILLGDNIGTTITALLASVGQSKNAKRTAVAHSVFNITGSALFLFLIPVLTRFVQFISPKGNEVDVISRQIANAHTTFNVVCTIIWLPLIPVMVKIVTWIIRGEDKKAAVVEEPCYLDEKMCAQPVAALYLVSNEIKRLAQYTADMLASLQRVLNTSTQPEVTERYEQMHKAVKSLQDAIAAYITKLFSQGTLTEQLSQQTAGLLFVSNNIDRIADRCEDIAEANRQIMADGRTLSDKAKSELGQCMEIVGRLFSQAMECIATGDLEIARKVAKDRNRMRKARKKNTKAHLLRVENQKCDAALTTLYSDMLYNLERLADNCVGIAEEAVDNVTYMELTGEEIAPIAMAVGML